MQFMTNCFFNLSSTVVAGVTALNCWMTTGVGEGSAQVYDGL